MFKKNLLFTTPIDNYYTQDTHKTYPNLYSDFKHFENKNFDEESFSSLKPEIDFFFNQRKTEFSAFESYQNPEQQENKDFKAFKASKDPKVFFVESRDGTSSPKFFPRSFTQRSASSFPNSYSQNEKNYYLKQNNNFNLAQKAKVDNKFSGTENNFTRCNQENNSQNFLNLNEAQKVFSPTSFDFPLKKSSFESMAMSSSDKSTADEISFSKVASWKNLNVEKNHDSVFNIFKSKNQTSNNNYYNNHLEITQLNNCNSNFTNENENFNCDSTINNAKKTDLENHHDYENQQIIEGLNFSKLKNSKIENAFDLEIVNKDFSINNLESTNNLKKETIKNYLELNYINYNKNITFSINNINSKNSNYSKDRESNNLNFNLENKPNSNSIELHKNKISLIKKACEANTIQNKNNVEAFNIINNNSNDNLQNLRERRILEFSEAILLNSIHSFSSEKCEISNSNKETNQENCSKEKLCCNGKVKITEIFKVNWKKCINIFKKFSFNSYKGILQRPLESRSGEATQNKPNPSGGNCELSKKNKKNKNKNKAKNAKSNKNNFKHININTNNNFNNNNDNVKKSFSDSFLNAKFAFENKENEFTQSSEKLEKANDLGRVSGAYKLSEAKIICSKAQTLSGNLSDVTNYTINELIEEKSFSAFVNEKNDFEFENNKNNNFNNNENENKNLNYDFGSLEFGEANTSNNNENYLNGNYDNPNKINSKCSSLVYNNDSCDKNKKNKNKKQKKNENFNTAYIMHNYNNYNALSGFNPMMENHCFQLNCNNFNYNNYFNNNINNNKIFYNAEVNNNFGNNINNNFMHPGNDRNLKNFNSKFDFVPRSFLPNSNFVNNNNNNNNNFVSNLNLRETKPYGF